MLDTDKIELDLLAGLVASATVSYPAKRKTPTEAGGKGFWVSCSELGGCPRRSYYNATDPINHPAEPGRTAGAALVGRLVHAWVEQVAREALLPYGSVRTEDLFWDRGCRLSGASDIVLTLKGHGPTVVFDVKTKDTKGFGYLARSRDPSPEEALQVRGYLMHYEAPVGFLLYVNRDSLLEYARVDAVLRRVERRDADVVAYLDKVEAAWRAGNPPTVPSGYQADRYPCAWCNYPGRCYSGGVPPVETSERGSSDEPHRKKTDPITHYTDTKKEIKYGW